MKNSLTLTDLNDKFIIVPRTNLKKYITAVHDHWPKQFGNSTFCRFCEKRQPTNEGNCIGIHEKNCVVTFDSIE